MASRLPQQPASVFARRRGALAACTKDRPSLVFAGGWRHRNFPAAPFPYRADSHFLYLTGAQLPDAAILVHGDRHELFVIPPSPDDALWHGPSPSFDDLARATGASAVRSVEELPAVIRELGGCSSVATIPSVDLRTRLIQARLLERGWDPEGTPLVSELDPIDRELVEHMVTLRLVHDEAALECMRKAAEGTAAAHAAGMAVSRPGITEHQVRAAMEHALTARGMPVAYGCIVTVRGEILHNDSYEHRLEDGDLLLADVGGEYEGWATDVTRTWPVNGRFSATQRALYEIVLQAEKDAIAMVGPGVRYRDIHLAASRTLARGLVDEKILRGDPGSLVERGAHAVLFPHGVGHLLGLDVHDMEDLGDTAGYAPKRSRSDQFGLAYLRLDRDLQPGMVVTIEPGIYLVDAILQDPKLAGPFIDDGSLDLETLNKFADVRGIRIEDDVLCTPTGHEVLTAAIPKDVEAVQAEVGSRTA